MFVKQLAFVDIIVVLVKSRVSGGIINSERKEMAGAKKQMGVAAWSRLMKQFVPQTCHDTTNQTLSPPVTASGILLLFLCLSVHSFLAALFSLLDQFA